MTVLWLIAWWIAAMPAVGVVAGLNVWDVALIACLAIDVVTTVVMARERGYVHGFGWTWTLRSGWTRDDPSGPAVRARR